MPSSRRNEHIEEEYRILRTRNNTFILEKVMYYNGEPYGTCLPSAGIEKSTQVAIKIELLRMSQAFKKPVISRARFHEVNQWKKKGRS